MSSTHARPDTSLICVNAHAFSYHYVCQYTTYIKNNTSEVLQHATVCHTIAFAAAPAKPRQERHGNPSAQSDSRQCPAPPLPPGISTPSSTMVHQPCRIALAGERSKMFMLVHPKNLVKQVFMMSFSNYVFDSQIRSNFDVDLRPKTNPNF